MSDTVQDHFRDASKSYVESATKPSQLRHKITRDCPRVTVRFSLDDYEKLQALANGASLAVYLRAKALDRELPRKKGRGVATIKDKAAVAQLLGLLAQSRIASNLNQLAYQANVGALVMDDDALKQVKEAYVHIGEMRDLLVKALGMRG